MLNVIAKAAYEAVPGSVVERVCRPFLETVNLGARFAIFTLQIGFCVIEIETKCCKPINDLCHDGLSKLDVIGRATELPAQGDQPSRELLKVRVGLEIMFD